MTHDFAFNTDRHVEPDSKGRIWITDMGTNELWGINVTSGEIKTYRMPVPAGESHFHSLIYGAAQDTQHNRVWYAQLFGNVGSLDTEHDIAERVIPFRKGAGPRRLALQEDGTLWIPLFGAGQLVKVDGETGAEIARYSFPDRGAAPYGITYDRRRNAIWAATSNSDRIYRFDIATQHWTQYPLPRRESYIRMIELDPRTNDVWTSYAALPVGERDPRFWHRQCKQHDRTPAAGGLSAIRVARYCAVTPPSITCSVAVMKLASSLARNTTRFDTSSGSAVRLTGTD